MVNAKILVAEDESIIAQDIRVSLQSGGYTVPAVVASGEEAIQKAAEIHPDLVLMDIHLQGAMDGVEAARQISTRLNVPIIYLTANADDSTFERAKVTGPFGYILKPFEERELTNTIEIALYKHQMENKLKEREQWLNAILSSIGDAVIATNANGAVAFMNPVAEALTGWQQVDAISKDLAEVLPIVHEETQISFNSPVIKAFQETDGISERNDTILLTKQGGRIAVDTTIGSLKDERGNSQGAVLVFRDISEQKRTEALKAFTVKLEQSNHELQEILYVTSHILPPPVRKIQLFSERLKSMGAALSEQGRYDLERIQDAAKRVKLIANELMKFYQITLKAQSLETVDLNKLAQEIVSDLAERIEQMGAQVQVGELAIIEADPTQMRQLLQHLIDNALKFRFPGRSPTVKVQGRLLRGSEQQLAGAASTIELCQILVKDNGIGFDEKYLDRIFNVFQQLHGEGEYEGTGIGLAICRRVVERHGGVLTAKSTQGEGTTFIVTLPVKLPNR